MSSKVTGYVSSKNVFTDKFESSLDDLLNKTSNLNYNVKPNLIKNSENVTKEKLKPNGLINNGLKVTIDKMLCGNEKSEFSTKSINFNGISKTNKFITNETLEVNIDDLLGMDDVDNNLTDKFDINTSIIKNVNAKINRNKVEVVKEDILFPVSKPYETSCLDLLNKDVLDNYCLWRNLFNETELLDQMEFIRQHNQEISEKESRHPIFNRKMPVSRTNDESNNIKEIPKHLTYKSKINQLLKKLEEKKLKVGKEPSFIKTVCFLGPSKVGKSSTIGQLLVDNESEESINDLKWKYKKHRGNIEGYMSWLSNISQIDRQYGSTSTPNCVSIDIGHHLDVIDCSGNSDFDAETIQALFDSDAAVICITVKELLSDKSDREYFMKYLSIVHAIKINSVSILLGTGCETRKSIDRVINNIHKVFNGIYGEESVFNEIVEIGDLLNLTENDKITIKSVLGKAQENSKPSEDDDLIIQIQSIEKPVNKSQDIIRARIIQGGVTWMGKSKSHKSDFNLTSKLTMLPLGQENADKTGGSKNYQVKSMKIRDSKSNTWITSPFAMKGDFVEIDLINTESSKSNNDWLSTFCNKNFVLVNPSYTHCQSVCRIQAKFMPICPIDASDSTTLIRGMTVRFVNMIFNCFASISNIEICDEKSSIQQRYIKLINNKQLFDIQLDFLDKQSIVKYNGKSNSLINFFFLYLDSKLIGQGVIQSS